MSVFWIAAVGLGMVFHGLLILWVGGLPRAFRPGEQPRAAKGTPEAFGQFWLDQYSYIGLVLAVLGALVALMGFIG